MALMILSSTVTSAALFLSCLGLRQGGFVSWPLEIGTPIRAQAVALMNRRFPFPVLWLDSGSVGPSPLLRPKGQGGHTPPSAQRAPLTRIPLGAFALGTRPSQLDYWFAIPESLADLRIAWEHAREDHAFVFATVPAGGAVRRPPRVWRPVLGDLWKHSLRATLLGDAEGDRPRSVPELSFTLARFEPRWRDRRSAAMRRRDRVPFFARSAWRRATNAANGGQRGLFQKQAREALIAASIARRTWCSAPRCTTSPHLQ